MENKKFILHIGFHKSGSTLIQNYFEEHPAVFFSRKIVSDFVNDPLSEIPLFEEGIEHRFVFLSDMRLTVNSWKLTELERVNSGNLPAEEIKKIQTEIAVRLKKRFPSAKILITTRDKTQLLSSLYSQYLLNGGRKSLREFKKDSRFLDTLFDYKFIENLYSEIFGKSNVHQMSYELLRENPEKFVQDICTINGFPFLPYTFRNVNSSLSIGSKIKRRIINNFVYYILFLFPEKKRNSIFKHYIHKTLSSKK